MAADPEFQEDLHHLIDQLNREHVETLHMLARRFRALEDPMLAVLNDAPGDDEPLTAEDEAAIEEGLQRYRRGEVVPLDQLMRELDEADD